MPEAQDSAAIAAAIRELANQVDALGNATISAAQIIAKAISGGVNVQVAPQPGLGERLAPDSLRVRFRVAGTQSI